MQVTSYIIADFKLDLHMQPKKAKHLPVGKSRTYGWGSLLGELGHGTWTS